MTEQIAGEQESGPGLRAIELGIAIPQYDRAHLAYHQPGEQRARQQDGEAIHQAAEEWLGVEVHRLALYI